MKFKFEKPKDNLSNIFRKLGYIPRGKEGLRHLNGGNYPRFHLFILEEKDFLIFNLHLDQKKPSYSGTNAHSGEYEGEAIQKEVERIKNILTSMH